MTKKANNHISLTQLADLLVAEIKPKIGRMQTEEDLRIAFEKILAPVLKELDIKSEPKYEKSIYHSRRADALHGQVVIEYEAPQAFRAKKWIQHAFEQLVGYIQGLSEETKETLFLFGTKFVGVGFDGEKIFFVNYVGNKKPKTKLDECDFAIHGPYDFTPESARTLLIHLRALSLLPLTAEKLAEKFGPKSELAPKAVSAFADALENWGGKENERVRSVFYNEWKRLFGIVYGEQFNNFQAKEAEVLSKLYKVGKETDFQELLFSAHTYFALLMKLIAAELLTLRETSFHSSFASELANASENELRQKLADIEDGGIYTRRGITNFLEGDFFRWYLDAWSPRLKEAIQDIAQALAHFEPATSTLYPNVTRDLLKKLYQYLVPQEVRHRLGEYYTPDWLAELVINEVGYDGNTLKSVLDPACGSGTFLVLAIQKAKEHGAKDKWPPLEIAKRIVSSIWGFDLNPLAVIAARTNYLFALGDLANELSYLEIPVYLADSVLWPQQGTWQMELNFEDGDYVKIKTSVKEFNVPLIWIKNQGFLMKQAAPLIEQCIKSGFEPEIAMKHFKKKGLVFPPNESVVENFYKDILELERQNKNGIWARFLKNAFAPMVAGQFDFVIGNPPWIRWDYLSQDYRKATLKLWKDYGLFSLKGFQTRLGGGKKDFSMLFTYASADYYLKRGAKLGFLITQEVFKSKGAGEGFRRFKLREDNFIKVLKAHDFSSFQPFEGAANKTAAIILKKGEKTEYPLPYYVWTKKKRVGKIPADKLLSEVLPSLQKKKFIAKPLNTPESAWQTFSDEFQYLSKIKGENYYSPHSGAYISPYGVFWLKIKQVLSGKNLLIQNLVEKGKTEIYSVEDAIESDLVYPALRGSDIQRWGYVSSVYILLTQDPTKRAPYSEIIMKSEWPKTYSYLTKFKEILLNRASRVLKDLMEKSAFYAVFGVADYTMSNYKVVWKRMTNDLIACVVSQYKTPFGYRTLIPLETTALIATDKEPEAHYLCAIINSTAVRDFIKSFSSAGRGFGTPSVMENVGIPKFDSKNKLHQKLADISKKCHQLKAERKNDKVAKLEKENDELVKKLFGC
jgi:type I restriction-modification system DNA methylase subunit